MREFQGKSLIYIGGIWKNPSIYKIGLEMSLEGILGRHHFNTLKRKNFNTLVC